MIKANTVESRPRARSARPARSPAAPANRSSAKRAASAPTLSSDRFGDVLIALRRIIRATDIHSKQLFKDSGLTIPQVIVLQSIRDLGEVTTGRISEYVNLSQATVTSILDRLEDRALIERYRSHSDRRVVHARLTKQGQVALRNAPPLLHERFVSAFAALSADDRDRITQTLQEVAEMMGAEHLDAAPLLDIGPPQPDQADVDG